MNCHSRQSTSVSLGAAVQAASRIAAHDAPLAITLARVLTSSSFTQLLEIDSQVANLVADATDLLDDALRRLSR